MSLVEPCKETTPIGVSTKTLDNPKPSLKECCDSFVDSATVTIVPNGNPNAS